ncbi:MAG: hypothetical protein ACR2JI_13250 [Mycobacterium sp.]
MGAGRIVPAYGLVIAAALALGVGSASADTEPAPDPGVGAPVEGPPVPVDPFAAVSTQTKDNPVAILAGLVAPEAAGAPAAGAAAAGAPAADAPAAASPAMSANPLAMANQGVGLTGTPPVDPLASVSSLYAHNFRMPSGDEASPYVLQTDVPPGPFARVDALKGLHAMLHGSLGRVPRSELGQALPGTAPPPGTNLPPGLEQFYVPPDAPADIPPPVPPFPLDTPAG